MDWLRSQFSFQGKRVLVTGASRGIGRALAEGYARAGADMVLTARRAETLDETAEAIRALGREATCIACDQRDVATIRAALAPLPPIDVLVNNAGVEDVQPSDSLEEAVWDKIVDTNLKGPFFVSQVVADGMAKRGGGAIVNLASLTSYVGIPTAVPYGASKTGILGITRALAAEWGPKGIRVNAIAPGYFRTALTETFYENPDWVSAMTAKVPLGRLGALDDLVGAALFLGGDASRYVTGQCLVVDGGSLAAL
ncbi:MAG: glucose 1-dehydrogenase [Pseudomonadota bacterium]